MVLSSRVHVPVLWFKSPAFSLNRTPWQSQSWGCPHSWCAESPPKVLEHPGRDLQSQSPPGPSASCIADTAALAACEEQSSAPSFSSYIKGLKFNMNFKRGRTGWSKAAGPGPVAEQRYLGTCPSSAEQQHCGTWRIIQPHPKCPGTMGGTGIPQMALLSRGFTELCSPWVTVVHMAHGTWRLHSPGSDLALHLHLSAGIPAALNNPPPAGTASPTRPGARCHPAHPMPAAP